MTSHRAENAFEDDSTISEMELTVLSSSSLSSTMKSHPGSVVHLSDNPLDSNKVNIHRLSPLILVPVTRSFQNLQMIANK